MLASGEREDINLEGVLRHSAADALSSLGVVVAGGARAGHRLGPIDPLVSIVIAVLIAAGSWRLLKEPLDVLMEAAPAGIDVAAVGEAMAAEPDVVEVHDLHVWTVTSGFPALCRARRSCGRDATGTASLRGVEQMLHERFGIDHTTLQMVEHGPDGLIQVERVDRSSRMRPIDHRWRLDDHLDRAAVDAPGRAGDVGRVLGAQEDDRRRDLVDLRQAPDRPPGARLLDRLLGARQPDSAADWSARPPSPIHSSDLVGPGQIALTSTPSAAHRSAYRRDSDSCAAFATEYSGM